MDGLDHDGLAVGWENGDHLGWMDLTMDLNVTPSGSTNQDGIQELKNSTTERHIEVNI